MNNKMIHMITFILLVIGGVNWLLVGLGLFNGQGLVAGIFGYNSVITTIIYIAVGLAAIYELAMHKSMCKFCAGK